MIAALSQYLAEQAAQKGVELVTDFPDEKITVVGLEERLAQVFVNLITNAISFCSFGGTIRFWARHRDNRVLIVFILTDLPATLAIIQALVLLFPNRLSRLIVALFGPRIFAQLMLTRVCRRRVPGLSSGCQFRGSRGWSKQFFMPVPSAALAKLSFSPDILAVVKVAWPWR